MGRTHRRVGISHNAPMFLAPQVHRSRLTCRRISATRRQNTPHGRPAVHRSSVPLDTLETRQQVRCAEPEPINISQTQRELERNTLPLCVSDGVRTPSPTARSRGTGSVRPRRMRMHQPTWVPPQSLRHTAHPGAVTSRAPGRSKARATVEVRPDLAQIARPASGHRTRACATSDPATAPAVLRRPPSPPPEPEQARKRCAERRVAAHDVHPHQRHAASLPARTAGGTQHCTNESMIGELHRRTG